MPASPLLTVRTITADEHLAFLATRRSASFLQVPAWAKVKSEWRSESLGWFRAAGSGEEIVGAGLVLYRQMPKLKRYLAYLPEGPVIDWDAEDLHVWLAPMTAHLKKAGAFAVRMGPPVITARWGAAAIKDGIADTAVSALGQIAPDSRNPVGARVVSGLRELGWKHLSAEGGFSAGQPQFNYVVPLTAPNDEGVEAQRTEDDLLKGMNQQWRRNIKKAAKEGVVVEQTDPRVGLKTFHDLYVHTAERDHFTPRPLSYFQVMFDALGQATADSLVDIRLYLARHEDDVVAATIWIRVGAHSWYSYGASSTHKREVRGSNAIQWRMITDALAEGCDVYDLRGITDTLDSDDPHVGLIQFKVGTGGEAVEYAGEWDLPINRALYKAFDYYMGRRG